MGVGHAAFQTVLDDGNVYNWFDSPFTVKLSLVAALALGAFVLWQFITPAPLVKFQPVRAPQFRLRDARQFPARFRALRLRLSATAIPRRRTRLRCRADRQGRGLDRIAAAPGDTARAASDEAYRHPAPRQSWPRRLRSELLMNLLARPGLCRAAALLAQCDLGARPGDRHDPDLGNRLGRDCAERGGRGLGPLQHDAQSRRRDRHRRDRDLLRPSRAVPFGDDHAASLARRFGDARPARGFQRYFVAHGYPDPAGAMHRAIIAVGQTIRTQATIMGYADASR